MLADAQYMYIMTLGFVYGPHTHLKVIIDLYEPIKRCVSLQSQVSQISKISEISNMCGDKNHMSMHFIHPGPLFGIKESENLVE